jgi:hypothetical protein
MGWLNAWIDEQEKKTGKKKRERKADTETRRGKGKYQRKTGCKSRSLQDEREHGQSRGLFTTTKKPLLGQEGILPRGTAHSYRLPRPKK